MSLGKQVKALVGALHRAAERKSGSMFTLHEIQAVAEDIRLRVPSIVDVVEVMNQQNYVLKKGPKLFQLQTSMYSQRGMAPEQRARARRSFGGAGGDAW